MEIERLKKEIRSQVRQFKLELTEEELHRRSALIFSSVEELPEFFQSKTLLVYWVMPDEVMTQPFIMKWYRQKNILLPVIHGDELVLRQFTGLQYLKTHPKYGIAEPQGEDFMEYDKIEIAIIPGIAFDVDFNRMGRGKGYYDRLLKKLKTFKLGVCFDFQLFNALPVNEWDVPMDLIITDRKMLFKYSTL